MSRRHLALPALLALLAAVPSAASGAAVVASTPCARVVPGKTTYAVQATGFTPGAFVTVKADEQTVASGQADPGGMFTAPATTPLLSSAKRVQQTFQLSATDDRGLAAAPVPLPVSRIAVGLPRRAKPSRVVRYRARGFAPGRRLYLHVRRGGRTLGTFSLGRTKGVCGNVTRRLRYMPLRTYSTGTYHYWFSHSRRYSVKTRIYRIDIGITRRVRSFAFPGARLLGRGTL